MRKQAAPPTEPVDDTALFRAAVADAAPLKSDNRIHYAAPPPKPIPKQFLADEQAALHDSLYGPIELQDRLEGGDEPNYLGPGLAQSILRDLRRGRWVVQGGIDLHGHNRDEARTSLAEFLRHALTDGLRCVRIIHGRGLGSPGKTSVLRQLVRGWLAQRKEVLAFCQTRPDDGGEGAMLVLLRSQK